MSLPAASLPAASLAAALLFAASAAQAAPPAPLAVTRAVEIAAPPAKVWAVMGNFGDLAYLSAAVEKTEIVRGRNNQPGAQRRISLKGGGTVLETLTARQPYRLAYRMDESPLPVADYRSTLKVAPAGPGSRLTWSGKFRSRPLGVAAGNDPDKAAVDAIAGLYEGGLAAIKAVAER